MSSKQDERLFKGYAQEALLCKYGFAPPKSAIDLLETHSDQHGPQYVLFTVGGHEYSYDGITMVRRS